MLLILFIFYFFLEVARSVCPGSAPYLLESTGVCYAECPWNPPQLYYATSTNNTCVTTCPPGRYGFDGDKTCVATCPSTPNMTFYDTVNSKCVVQCPANYYSYLGAGASNQSCVSTCPSATFAQQTKRQCVSTCPASTFYKNDSSPFCVVRCPDNFYASPLDKNCKVGGTCPTSPVRYYSDDVTNLCVQTCPINTFSDDTSGRCLIYCSSGYFADKTTWRCVQNCPTDYYRSNITKSCLLKCTQGYFIDRLTKNCTQSCSANTFGDFSTGFCQSQCTFGTFSDSTLSRCVSVCSFGLYADNFTSNCVVETSCNSNWVGDPTTRKCVEPSNCPKLPYHYANLVAKKCVPKCPTPLWGDKSTRTCVSNCPWNDKTYVSWKNPDTQQCVTTCPQFPILYADNYTQTCVAKCPAQSATIAYDTFGDDLSQTCVRNCPNGFKAQKPQYVCVSQCSNNPTILYYFNDTSSCISQCPLNYYGDPSKQLCVKTCPSNPDYYGYDTTNLCLSGCPNNFYADKSTRKCVSWCPQTTLQYADNSTNQCVDTCPTSPDYFGLDDINGNKICVDTCSVGLFADPLTRKCVEFCNMDEGFYGQFTTPLRRCVLQCPPNFYADNITGTCVSKCPSFPIIYYGNPSTKKCELMCPEFLYGNSVTNVCGLPTSCQSGFFADDSTNRCVKVCPITELTFGQSTSRRCLKTCPEGNFSDNTTRKCSSSCNATAKLYKDPSSNRCVTSCPSTPNLYNDPLTMLCSQACTGGYFAYDGSRKCVQMCPATPPFFGNVDTHRCVATCPPQSYRFVTNAVRQCRGYCPASYMGDLYADNTTWSCVSVCPKAAFLYSFKHPSDTAIRTCVLTCPVVITVDGPLFYFADDVSQSCVQTCPLKNLTWGDMFTLKCANQCSRNQFRDNSTFRCTYSCAPPLFADNTTWDCVKKCPNKTYAFASGTNRTCLSQCPTGTYADNNTNFCRSLCDNDVALWSDNTTWQCIKTCPTVPDMYADPNSDKCQYDCSNFLFADKKTRKCVTALQCSDGTIGDPTTYRCIVKCPISVPSFWEESTNKCVTQCQGSFFADNSTMKCMPKCPSTPDYYAYTHATLGPLCVLYCPSNYYKHTPTRVCRTDCPSPDYFRDTTTMKCVTSCPDHFFAQVINQICVSNCSINSKYGLDNVCSSSCTGEYNKDPTTFLCVKACPFTYFSQANVCTQTCTVGYADPITKKCQPLLCSPGYYAQTGTRKCVRQCYPEYKHDPTQTCRPACPITNDNATNLYMDNNTYMCINVCKPGWYSDNTTGYCHTACSADLFADNSTGRCISKCPEVPDYFGYQKVCYFPCPSTGLYAQNTSRLCLSRCPDGGYADNYNQRCMDKCTLKQYSHSYTTLSIKYNVCLEMCPEGFFSSDPTKSCVDVCPEGTYGENDTNKCVAKCPLNAYADQFLNLCVLACDVGRDQYKDWTTRRCVPECPQTPSLYAEDSSRSCVPFCQVNWYGYNETRVCTQNCPSPYYSDPTTGFCQLKCYIGANRFADDISRSCVLDCPNYTEPVTNKVRHTYEDNSTKRCVQQCPFFPSLYGHNLTNACVEDCPPGTFGDNDTRLCLDKCFFNQSVNGEMKYTWADSTTHFCVKQCPPTWFADNLTVECTQSCSQGSYSDNSTWRCVFMCPANPISFAKLSTRQCVYNCDEGFFGDQLSRKCLTDCPTEPYYYYKDSLHQRCVKNCSSEDGEYYAQDLSQSCVTDCTIGYFKSLSQHACVHCPSTCLVCFGLLNCTSCAKGMFLYQGQCLQSCPSFPIRYYANDLSSACQIVCPSPYFGFDDTGKCQINCPQKYYNDIIDSTCKLCNTGCRTCSNSTTCLSCTTGFVYVSASNSCSKICNSSHIYFVDTMCAASCVDGTFLLSDLVTCQKCNTQCLACSLSGNNCTRCANLFWYNYNCVSSCPQKFYADKNNICLDCETNANACSVEPLRFTITTETKNYILYAYVTFNRAVNLTIQQFNQIVVIKTSTGPIKSSSYKVSVLNQTTFVIQFLNNNSPNQMSLSIGFVPGSIGDSSGSGLAETSQSLNMETLSTISPQAQKTIVAMKSNMNVLSYILVALIIAMMIKCSYPMIVLIDFLQIIYLHLYVKIDTLPYLWMNVVAAMENINFSFLPKILSEPNTKPSNPYSLFKTDITFIGNMQPLVYIGVFFSILFLIFWGISRFRCKIWILKKLRKPFNKIFKYRMKFSFFHQIFYYTQVYVFFFAVLQWPSNRSSQNTIANLSLSVIAAALYISWLVFILYKSSVYRNNLSSMPKRFKFLALQPTKFPMDTAVRYTVKLLFCLCFMISDKTAQLIFCIAINIVYFLFNLIYKPAIQSKTNYINMFISLGFIGYQVLLFMYSLQNPSAQIQLKWSYLLFAVAGTMFGVIIVWMCYRFVLHMKVVFNIGSSKKKMQIYEGDQQLASGNKDNNNKDSKDKANYNNNDKQLDDIKSDVSENVFSFFNWNKLKSSKSTSKPLKSQYNKLGGMSKSMVDEDQKTVKNMLPELHFNHHDEEDDSEPSLNDDQLINEFAYHMVPKKNPALLKAEKQVIARNQAKRGVQAKKKRVSGPMIIAIDQDELIDKNIEIIDNTKPAQKTDIKAMTSRIPSKPNKQENNKINKQENDKINNTNKIPEKKQGKGTSLIWNEHLQQDSENWDIELVDSNVFGRKK